MAKKDTFIDDLADLLKKHKKGESSETPVYIYVDHICTCLDALEQAIADRLNQPK